MAVLYIGSALFCLFGSRGEQSSAKVDDKDLCRLVVCGSTNCNLKWNNFSKIICKTMHLLIPRRWQSDGRLRCCTLKVQAKGQSKRVRGEESEEWNSRFCSIFCTFLDVIQKEVNNTRKEQMEIAVNVYGQHPNEWWNNWSLLQWVLNYQNGTLCQSAICIFSEYLKIETIAFRQIRRHSVTPHLPVFEKTTKRRDDQTILNYRRTEKEDADHNEKKLRRKRASFRESRYGSIFQLKIQLSIFLTVSTNNSRRRHRQWNAALLFLIFNRHQNHQDSPPGAQKF